MGSSRSKRISSRVRERGFALLIVLWTLSLLAWLATHMAATGRTEAVIALNLRRAAVPEAVADAAISEAVFRFVDQGSRHWPADGRVRQTKVLGAPVLVSIENEADRVNLNTASVDLLRALLQEVGADERRARSVAQAIAGWRGDNGPAKAMAQQYAAAGLPYAPVGAPFQSGDELGLVLGMTNELLERLAAHVTVWSDSGPGASTRDPVVRRALARVRAEGGRLPDDENYQGSAVLGIVANASDEAGGSFVRHAVVRVNPAEAKSWLLILVWDEGQGSDAASPVQSNGLTASRY